MRARAAFVPLCVAVALTPPTAARAHELGASLLVRGDGDGTQVVSPRLRARLSLDEERWRIDLAYAADVWTSASIDVRTSATGVIRERRDEARVGLEGELGERVIRGGYRVSVEHDYVSHSAHAGLRQEIAGGAAGFEVRLHAAVDRAWRARERASATVVSTVGARVVYTQAIDEDTHGAVVYEVSRRDGVQSSPYRFVAIGGDGGCGDGALLCLPERHPTIRVRHAASIRARRALFAGASVGGSYRFYIDGWGVLAHTARLDAVVPLSSVSAVGLEYRLHAQSAASFYERLYPVSAQRLRHVSRDRELSAMQSHRVGLRYELRARPRTSAEDTLRLFVGVGAALLHYDAFIGLGTVWAIDTTCGATLSL